MTFFVTSFPKNVTFWHRQYKTFLNGKKCDFSAWTEKCISLAVSDFSHISRKREAGRPFGLGPILNDHVEHMSESCSRYEWVMSHICMSHVTHVNGSWHTCEWVISQRDRKRWQCLRKLSIRYISYTTSYRTYECYTMSYSTYECVISHIWMLYDVI